LGEEAPKLPVPLLAVGLVVAARVIGVALTVGDTIIDFEVVS